MKPKYPSHHKPPYPADRKLTGEERKEITNRFLEEIGVPVYPQLPSLSDFRTTSFRNNEAIAKRCVILNQLLYRLFFTDPLRTTPAEVIHYFEKCNVWDDVSPAEKSFINEYDPLNNASFGWRYENVGVLEWSLGVFDWLHLPVMTFRYGGGVQEIPSVLDDPTEWIKTVSLRNSEEILNERDLTYRIHYAVQEYLKNVTPGNDDYIPIGIPTTFQFDKFIPEIVSERCHALHWLTHPSESWDDIHRAFLT